MGKMVLESRTEWRFAIRLRRERPSPRRGVLAPAKAGFVRGRANQGGTTAKFAVLDRTSRAVFLLYKSKKGEHRAFTHHPDPTFE